MYATGAIALTILAYSFIFRGGTGSGLLIAAGFLALLWVGWKEFTPGERWLGRLMTFYVVLSASFAWEWELAGLTHDTYLHLFAAFVATLLLHRLYTARKWPYPLLWAALVAFALGLGVELVQWLDRLAFSKDCVACLLDTIKDVINDVVGIGLAAIRLSTTIKGRK